MQLEKIAAVVRPRRPWEAVDLGFMMARAWWGPVMRSWLLIVTPFCAAVALALYAFPRWTLFAIWWAKPLYDRVPLYVLSRALFGAVPRVAEVRGELPRLWLEQSFAALTFLRLDPMRSFLMPAARLEGVSGAERRKRSEVLKRGDAATPASWLTAACFIFELGTLAALIGLFELLRPPEVMTTSLWQIFAFVGDASAPRWHAAVATGLYFVAMTLIEPFYVAGGFALYLNRRTELEGWDVDLAFRRLARRLRQSGRRRRRPPGGQRVAVLLAAAGALSFAAPAPAEEPAPAGDPQQVIREILEDPEFETRRTVERWSLRDLGGGKDGGPGLSAPGLGSLAALAATAIEVLAWAALAAAVVVLAVAAVRRFGRPFARNDDAEVDEGPRILAGVDVSAESLPDDVVAEALARWRAGRPDEALSLLYRGALASLVERRHLPIDESWTESDCLRHLRSPSSPVPPQSPLVEYFGRLTRTWQRTAYAHRPPSDGEMRELSGLWPTYFGPPRLGVAS